MPALIHGLTPRESEALGFIELYKHFRISPSLTDLARCLKTNKSGASHLVDRLRQKGHIARSAKRLPHSRYGGIRVNRKAANHQVA